ncbi:MAG: hypothetical protein Q4G19_06360 [Clostridia bacterium]|nr:hypothetical protein [Clostridia bacterium]
MKRFLCVLALLVLALTPVLASAATMKVGGFYYVKTANGLPLKVRSTPDATSDANILNKIPYRQTVSVERVYNGTWVYVTTRDPDTMGGELKGYIMSKYLTSKDPGPYKSGGYDGDQTGPSYEEIDAACKALVLLDEPYQAVITTKNPANWVHLRWIPNTNARYSAKYLCDTEILVLAESNTWAQVQIVDSGYVGFILKSCVAPLY